MNRKCGQCGLFVRFSKLTSCIFLIINTVPTHLLVGCGFDSRLSHTKDYRIGTKFYFLISEQPAEDCFLFSLVFTVATLSQDGGDDQMI